MALIPLVVRDVNRRRGLTERVRFLRAEFVTFCSQAAWASSRPARDRTARCSLHWCRRGSSRLDPVIPGSAARAELGMESPRHMTAVERRKASDPLTGSQPSSDLAVLRVRLLD